MAAIIFRRGLHLVAAACVCLALCWGGGTALGSNVIDQSYGDTVSIRLIDPALTDPAIDQWRDPHVIMRDPGAVSQGRLFVMLPGSFGRPENLQLVLRTGALRGYHVIGLRYPNDWTVNSLCDRTNDPGCYGAVRDEIVNGVDRSPYVAISPANAILHRLEAALRYLHATYPDEGWGAFLDKQEHVLWSRVSVGGHSQGGGHAAFLAKQQPVGRVCMFSSPLDVLGTGQSAVIASWLSQPGLTPIAAHTGLVAEREGGYTQIVLSWEAMGVPGAAAPINVDALPTISPDAHSLSTDVEPGIPGGYHSSTVTDSNTPLTAEGVPVLKPVWEHMCFPLVASRYPVYLPVLMALR